ncbi:pilus (MSHA type) biogenesis protein MshL [Campylobacter sp. MIT 97-5078]|uniref:pilus (MSHA type) biogenesis protein MshL n=1 Tax=Campylobacter sp. MIT 97-5078 TaxID=1548153 RepID=UPI000B0A5DC3|nr:pilus (MSHA type) biogenesis protein MshL [Campylobacter sp. MIT 97-5078]TQR25500.1 pilus (MSHA type) biogenesis protein MshL [Campylobacter sp. MIT 97-5078]
MTSFFLLVVLQNHLNACSKRLFDLSVLEEVSTEEILEELALECSFSIIVADENARDKIALLQKNIHIKQMSLDEIFHTLIKEQNLHFDFNGKILKISSLKTQIFKLNYITSIREGQSVTKASVDSRSKQNDFSGVETNTEDNVVKSLERFNFWQDIQDQLSNLLELEKENKAIIINANTGLITITGTPNQLLRAKKYIDMLRARLKKQVIIDVSIIAVSLNETHSSGINWQNFSLDFNSQNKDGTNSNLGFQSNQNGNLFVKNLGLNTNVNLSSVLNFLSQNGQTKVLSNPKLVALNNQQAIISVGDTINYQVKESSKSTESGTTVSEVFNNYSIFVGILLNILPEISDDNKIMLRINPSLSSFKYPQDSRRQDIPRNIAPDTIQKKLSTVVQMDNNQTLILGGLISHDELSDENSVNFLSSIPLLGALFRSENQGKQTSEIVFIITPRIIENSSLPSLKDLGYSL